MRKQLIIAFIVCSACAYAQKDTGKKVPNEKYIDNTYCLSIKEGKPVLMSKGKKVTKDVTLKNGTQITSSGKVIKTDGTQVELQENDCINTTGEIIKASNQPAGTGNTRKK